MKCPKCNKEPAIIHTQLGVLPGRKCQARYLRERIPPGGRRSVESRLREYATPFWKIMGLAPKPKEIEAERRMKWAGKTYLDVQRERLAGAKQTFDSTPLKRKLLAGKLVSKSKPTYEKRQP
ncbi:hypothetical protein HZB78_05615 [Candidatus Collierbacteria bacterium]|nr:hypothetical protein [Candidatus Collierbacteria bacterium]